MARRWALVLIGLAAAVWPLGCGSSLTGGSIPPGRSRAAGIVVRGDNAGVRVSSAVLRFQADSRGGRRADALDERPNDGDPPDPPDFGGGDGGGTGGGTGGGSEGSGTIRVSTNADGSFSVEALPARQVELQVSPPTATGLEPIRYDLDFTGGATYWVVSAPLPRNVSLAGLSGVEVAPSEIRLAVGESVQIQVRLLGGSPPAVVPSYLVRGDMGVVNERGRFTAVRTGSGTLRVIVGPFETTLPVGVAAAR